MQSTRDAPPKKKKIVGCTFQKWLETIYPIMRVIWQSGKMLVPQTCFISVLTGNKRVSFEEFLPIFLSCQGKKEQGTMEDFIEGLRVFDKDGNGFINSAELRHVLTSLGKSYTFLLTY